MNANLEDPSLLESRLTLMGTLLGSPHKKNALIAKPVDMAPVRLLP